MKKLDLALATAIIKFKNHHGGNDGEPIKSWLIGKKLEFELSEFIKDGDVIEYEAFVDHLIAIEHTHVLEALSIRYNSLKVDQKLLKFLPKLFNVINLKQEKLNLVKSLLQKNKIDLIGFLIFVLVQYVDSINKINTDTKINHAYLVIYNTFKKEANLKTYNTNPTKEQSNELIKFLIPQIPISKSLHKFILASLLIITMN